MSQGGIQQFWLHKRKDVKKSKIVKIIKNKIVICLPMEYLEVLKNSFKSVCAFRSNWRLELLVFKENTRVTGEKSSQSKGENQQQTQRTNQDLNPTHIGARRELLPMHHPCSPQKRRKKMA